MSAEMEKLTRAFDEIFGIVKALTTEKEKQADEIRRLRNVVREQSAEIERLRGALEFYAAPDNWQNETVDIGVGEMSIPLSSRCDNDCGRIANGALNTNA